MSDSIKNEVKYINSEDLNILKLKILENNQAFMVELDGIKIQSWIDYITAIQSKFKFPTPCLDSVDRYLDWIRDLEWLEQKEFIIIINNFGYFCRDNILIRNEIILDFEETILPYWQDEVEDVVVGGTQKSFMVYLVE